jgi:ketosteroid isomerase-like protein
MGEREDFLDWVRSELKDAEVALLAGDAGPRRRIWARQDPVTVFGAWKNAVGPHEVQELFSALEQRFSDCKSYDFEIVAADVVGDVAYTVGYEHVQATVGGEPRTFTLRASQVYRREGGEWKVVHRHGDEVADSQ